MLFLALFCTCQDITHNSRFNQAHSSPFWVYYALSFHEKTIARSQVMNIKELVGIRDHPLRVGRVYCS
jgi:hypothetical protein